MDGCSIAMIFGIVACTKPAEETPVGPDHPWKTRENVEGLNLDVLPGQKSGACGKGLSRAFQMADHGGLVSKLSRTRKSEIPFISTKKSIFKPSYVIIVTFREEDRRSI